MKKLSSELQAPGTLSWIWRALAFLFRVFCSLKLAIVILLVLAAALAVGTVLESVYDTPTAQYWVYRALWFHFVLAMLGVLIFCVAMSRLPWKKRHIPFLMAHAGIIILLVGSWLTDRFGVDGILRFSEGETGSVVELAQPLLLLSYESTVRSYPIAWTPPHAKFAPVSIPEFGLTVDQMISHADVKVDFVPTEASANSRSLAALKLQLAGGPMRMKEEFWLFGGGPGWNTFQMGPARVSIVSDIKNGEILFKELPGPWMILAPEPENKRIATLSRTSSGELHRGEMKWPEGKASPGKNTAPKIDPRWNGAFELTVLDAIPKAKSQVTYSPSTIQYGQAAPPSAIRLKAGTGENASELWLGMGDRGLLELGDKTITVAYYPQRVVLPFALRLERFSIDRYPGTQNPASFSSDVRVVDRENTFPVTISMNEPLDYNGFTFYQSSYEDADPRPVTSILSVNKDPGRFWKYLGSALIVLGSILLFASRRRKKAPSTTLGGASK